MRREATAAVPSLTGTRPLNALPNALRSSQDAQKPISTQGTQVIMIQIGKAATVSLKLLARRAVSQCWNRCGNIPTESGTSMLVPVAGRPM